MSPRTVTMASPSEGVLADSNSGAIWPPRLGGGLAGSEATRSAAMHAAGTPTRSGAGPAAWQGCWQPLSASTIRHGSDRLYPSDGRHAVDRPVERGDHPDPRPLRLRDQVRLGEVQPVKLIDFQRSQQRRRVQDHDGWERDDRAGQGGDPGPRHLEEGLQHVHDLGDHQVGQQELFGGGLVSTKADTAWRPRATRTWR